ncbi:methylenetetrahydrofolate reductase [Rhodovulum sp. DZ06]|uniref:methylenetetrahydrofolate reductase n=1 Tax=Rhodovulum sp. DZ06 TaxID=3425126 RepID=UPI003D332360
MAKVIDLFKRRKAQATEQAPGDIAGIIGGYSLEVMPRTAAKVESFAEILPADTLVYIAHIDGTPIEDMVSTAARLAGEGFDVMPHIPARIVPDRATLDDWLARYQGEAGVDKALLLGGGLDAPKGDFHCSMQLMETGLFDARGFKRLHVAGHPEGNKDIDPDGGEKVVMEALRWKQDFAARTDAQMAIATQFCFEVPPVLEWAARLREAGIDMPIHLGVAGPAKLQTLVKFAMACGVGASARVLTRRAADVTKLMMPFTPEDFLRELTAAKAADPALQVERVHFFPLGGIKATADFTRSMTGAAPKAAAQA